MNTKIDTLKMYDAVSGAKKPASVEQMSSILTEIRNKAGQIAPALLLLGLPRQIEKMTGKTVQLKDLIQGVPDKYLIGGAMGVALFLIIVGIATSHKGGEAKQQPSRRPGISPVGEFNPKAIQQRMDNSTVNASRVQGDARPFIRTKK